MVDLQYLDFELEVSPDPSTGYRVTVLRSPAGEATAEMRLPFDTLALENRLQALQIALLRSGNTRRRIDSPEEETVRRFGEELFGVLFSGEILGRLEVSRSEARQQKQGLRLKLRFTSPELAALPWEYLYDASRGDFLALSVSTPIVRYIPMAQPMEPLTVEPPLRVLGMVVSPRDLPELDTDREKQRVEHAVADLKSKGLIEVTWLPKGSWRELLGALRKPPWHIFHFVGHGSFDEVRGEGTVIFADERGRSQRMSALDLGRLLGDHEPMRLAILNACEGARGDSLDVFSSTAATLVRRGTPAVVAMQYEITDDAAIEFSRAFYEAVADSMPVDAALSDARKAVSLAIPNTLEWGTPVLYMRAPDGVLFDLAPVSAPVAEPAGEPAEVVETAEPPAETAETAEPSTPAGPEPPVELPIAAAATVALAADVPSPPMTAVVADTPIAPDRPTPAAEPVRSLGGDAGPTRAAAPAASAGRPAGWSTTPAVTRFPTRTLAWIAGIAGGLLLLVLVAAAILPSIAGDPGISLSTAAAAPGDVVSASGTGFGSGEEVALSIGGLGLGRTMADADGSFTANFVLPADFAGATVVAEGLASGGRASSELGLVGAAPPSASVTSVTPSDGSTFVAPSQSLPVLEPSPPASFIPPPPTARPILFFSNAEGNFDVYGVDPDGGAITRLTSTSYGERFPALSPDGSTVAFSATIDGNEDIYLMGLDGSGLTRLTDDPAADWYPSWSPDGAWITFVSRRDDPDSDIYIMPSIGGEQTRLTSEIGLDRSPSWAPDGLSIAFFSERDGNAELYAMAPDGSELRRGTNDPAEDRTPSWSPDGAWVAFISDRAGSRAVYLLSASTGEIRPLTDDPRVEGNPVWSPDGTRIAFYRARSTSVEEGYVIWVMGADGSDPRPLTDGLPGDSLDPTWR